MDMKSQEAHFFQVYKLVKWLRHVKNYLLNAGPVHFRKSPGFRKLSYFWFISDVVLWLGAEFSPLKHFLLWSEEVSELGSKFPPPTFLLIGTGKRDPSLAGSCGLFKPLALLQKRDYCKGFYVLGSVAIKISRCLGCVKLATLRMFSIKTALE